jgi:hypothetical protein
MRVAEKIAFYFIFGSCSAWAYLPFIFGSRLFSGRPVITDKQLVAAERATNGRAEAAADWPMQTAINRL